MVHVICALQLIFGPNCGRYQKSSSDKIREKVEFEILAIFSAWWIQIDQFNLDQDDTKLLAYQC